MSEFNIFIFCRRAIPFFTAILVSGTRFRISPSSVRTVKTHLDFNININTMMTAFIRDIAGRGPYEPKPRSVFYRGPSLYER